MSNLKIGLDKPWRCVGV